MELLLWGALAIDGVILLAALVKWRAVAVASKWPSAKGRILTSDTEARQVSRIADGVDMIQVDDLRNFAAIRYAFNVGERKFKAHASTSATTPAMFTWRRCRSDIRVLPR